MPAAFPSGSNTFVKDHTATGGMIINFSRNPSDFALNQYIQIRPVEKEAGYYLRFTVEEAGRIQESDLKDFVWFDGSERPLRVGDTESFLFLEYKTTRRDYGAPLGRKAIDQAAFDVKGTIAAIKAQQAMTARTQIIYTEVSNTANHDTGHYSAVASISGNTGNWAQSTTQRQDIKRSINYAVKQILQDTLGVVKPDQLVLVMGPDTAMEVSQTQEIVDHVKHSPLAWAQVKGEEPGRNALFGLPDKLYGVPTVIDATYKTTTAKSASSVTKSPIWASGVACLMSRPGALVNEGGGPSFSSATLFAFEEMTVESLDDERNRRVETHIVEDNDGVLTAPAATFLFTSAV